MKNVILLSVSLLISGAVFSSAMAQDVETARAPAGKYSPADDSKPPVISRKKKAAKKRKNSAAKPVSEYKFTSTDAQTSYRFDKTGAPIITKRSSVAGSSGGKKPRGSGKKSAVLPSTGQKKMSLKTSSGAVRYVCPMGEYESDKPGTCPKCGMTLVEKK